MECATNAIQITKYKQLNIVTKTSLSEILARSWYRRNQNLSAPRFLAYNTIIHRDFCLNFGVVAAQSDACRTRQPHLFEQKEMPLFESSNRNIRLISSAPRAHLGRIVFGRTSTCRRPAIGSCFGIVLARRPEPG